MVTFLIFQTGQALYIMIFVFVFFFYIVTAIGLSSAHSAVISRLLVGDENYCTLVLQLISYFAAAT